MGQHPSPTVSRYFSVSAIGNQARCLYRELRNTGISEELVEVGHLDALTARYLAEATRRAIASPGTVTLPGNLRSPDPRDA